MPMSYQLFYSDRSAAQGVRVILEELGQTYELIETDIKSSGPRSPELLAVHLVTLARELRLGPFNIEEADRQAHRRFCNTPFVTSAGNSPRSRLFSAALSGWRQCVDHRVFSRFGGQIDAPSSEQNPTVPPHCRVQVGLGSKWLVVLFLCIFF